MEYRYADYGPYCYDSVTSFPGFTGQQEPRFSTIRAGAAYSSDDVATVYPRAALSIKSGDDAFVFLSGQISPNFAE